MTIELRLIYYWTHMLDKAFGNKSAATARRLSKAKKNKYDEFYTSYSNVEKLIAPFAKHLKGKKILMPVDSPSRSELYLYMYENFNRFKLAELVAIGFGDDHMVKVTADGNSEDIPVTNGGDFTRGESLAAIDDCDIVIGNPPFSSTETHKLGPDFFRLPIEHGKDVIGIETPEKTTYGFFKDAIFDKSLTVYTCPYNDFNVPVDDKGNRVRGDTGKYEIGKVNVYVFSTFNDVHELKLKMNNLFNKAIAIGVRYDDLPDCPHGPRSERTDIKVLYDYETGSHTYYTWIPPKPKMNEISRPLIAMSCYDVLGYNWERYFNLIDLKEIKGILRNPRTGDEIISPEDNEIKDIRTKMFIFEYK